jgi:hypothetical protein
MNKERLYESINGIDDDILECSENAVLKKSRKSWVKWSALAAACLGIIAVGIILSSKGAISNPFEDDSKACYASIVYYNGGEYGIIVPPPDNIELGKELGIVKQNLIGGKGVAVERDVKVISSTVLKPGDKIYELAGYSPEYRICGKKADGTLVYFERQIAEGLAQKTPAVFFPEISAVSKITICDNNPTQLGEITDAGQIQELLQLFTEEAKFTDPDEHYFMGGAESRRLYLTLADNSQTEILFYDKKVGHWMGYVTLPDGFWELIENCIVYEGGEDYLNYGVLYAVIDYANYGYSDGYRVNSDYAMEPAWAVNGELRMGWYADGYTILAKDAAGFIRIENSDIWYLNTLGDVAHLRFWYPHYQGTFYDAVMAGEDLSGYVTVREVLYEGPFLSLQVRDGIVWTLDGAGILRRDGEQVAEGVTCFALDPGGVTYGRADGLFRLKSSDSRLIQLADKNVTAVAPAGIKIYYATDSGEICRVRVDGAENTSVYHLPAVTMHYFYGDRNGALAILGSDGNGYLLYEESMLYLAAENAAGIEVDPNGITAILYQDGELELTWSSHEPDNGGLYIRDTWLAPIGN